jgi:hypothetical protein
MNKEEILILTQKTVADGNILLATQIATDAVLAAECPPRFQYEVKPLVEANFFNFFNTNYRVLDAGIMVKMIYYNIFIIAEDAVKQLLQEEAEANAPISQKNLLLNNIDRLID